MTKALLTNPRTCSCSCSSAAERSAYIRKVRGSNPRTSTDLRDQPEDEGPAAIRIGLS